MTRELRRCCAYALLLSGAVAAPLCAQDDDPARREGFFYQQRAFPFDRIPAGSLERALTQMHTRWPRTRTGREGGIFASLVNTTASWTALGPAPISTGTAGADASGRINSIVIHPSDPQTLYIGAATGGVWKSTNGGTSWSPLTDNECGLAMGSVALDPVNPQIVYAGTGEENFSSDSYQGCGVLRSTDGGSTWTQLGASTFITPSGTASRIAKVIVDPATAGSTTSTVLMVASQTGLWRSSNSGQTWTLSLAGIITDLVLDPSATGAYIAAIGSTGGSAANGIYRTSDYGASWTKLGGGLPTASVGRINLGMATTSPNVLYASVQQTSANTLLGIWRTTDGGTTWTKLTATNASCSTQCWYDMVLAVDPSNVNRVFFGGVSLFLSQDGGNSFAAIGSPIVHVDHHAFAIDAATPTTVYSGNDGGIFRSLDGGTTWSSLNTNIAITQFYPGISTHPTNADLIIGGTQDNGTMEFRGVARWPRVVGGDGGFTAIDHKTGTRTFATCQWPTCVPFRRDGAGAFLSKGSGIVTSDRGAFIPPLVMDPINPSVLYFGTFRLYRTADAAESWGTISADLTNGTGTIRTIAIAPTDSQTIYTGASDGAVHVTTDLGATWTNISAGLPLKSVTYIAVDPRDPRTAWVTLSGFGTGHVWKTTNRGASWTDISFDLPNVPTNAVVLQRGSRELAIGTDIGVFALPEGATTWQPLAAGLPNTVVHDLRYDGARGRLLAATHGRGMFSLAVAPAALRGNVTATGTLSALDAQAILSSVVGLPLPVGAKRFPNGDANCDGDVTAVDALLVLSKLVGLPTGSACVGTVR